MNLFGAGARHLWVKVLTCSKVALAGRSRDYGLRGVNAPQAAVWRGALQVWRIYPGVGGVHGRRSGVGGLHEGGGGGEKSRLGAQKMARESRGARWTPSAWHQGRRKRRAPGEAESLPDAM